MSIVNRTRKLAIIPVYDQVDTIGKVLLKFKALSVDEICLVVDCPSKNIMRQISESGKQVDVPIHIIENSQRMGVGYAIREGVDYALRRQYDIVVVLAGNAKDDPKEIPRLLAPILKHGCDYVQGSRFLAGGRRVKNPILRGVFSRLYPFLWTLFTGVRCTDVTNGFRAYRTEIFRDKRINIWQSWLDGYGLEYYVHFKVLKLRYNTREVPVSKIYPFRNKGGYSKIFPLRDWWQIVGPFVYLVFGARD